MSKIRKINFWSRLTQTLQNTWLGLRWNARKLLAKLRFRAHSLLTRNGIQGRVLVLIDMHDHTRGGHFGTWLHVFAEEFSKRFDRVVVMTPTPWLTMQVFRSLRIGLRGNIYFRPLPDPVRQRFDLGAVQNNSGLRSASSLGAFVMWGSDLLDFLPCESPIPWAALSGCSFMHRIPGHLVAKGEAALVQKFESSNGFVGFCQHDYFLNGRHADAVYLPDIEPVATERRFGRLARSASRHKGQGMCLGFIGILTAHRGLNEFLLLSKLYPNIRFILAGQLVRESALPELQPLLDQGSQENLFIYPNFISDDRILNSVIKTTDAVFIDGRSYPVHSAVSCRALYFGVGIVTPNSNSWAADVVNHFGAGIVYENPRDDIAGALSRWLESGGPSRAKKASSVLKSPADRQKCFADIADRLNR